MEFTLLPLITLVIGVVLGALGSYALRKKDPEAFAEAAAIFKAKALTPEQIARLKAKIEELVKQA